MESLSKLKFIHANKNKMIKKYNLPLSKRIIFFISEELKNHFNLRNNKDLGYDEFVVIEHIKSSVRSEDHIVIKLHPEERKRKFNRITNDNISIISDCPINDILSLADVVIGMNSMLLLELSMHRNDIISYRPNTKKKFIGEELGVTLILKIKKNSKNFRK